VISAEPRLSQTFDVWRPSALEEDMLEWKPRLVVLLVGLASFASLSGFVLSSGNFGWGLW